MVGRVGIEPTTGRLKAECSTAELTPRIFPPLLGPKLLETTAYDGRDDTEPCVNDKPKCSRWLILYNYLRRQAPQIASALLPPDVSDVARRASLLSYPDIRVVL